MGTTFEEIYTPQNRQQVLAVCRKMLRNLADAEDAAQDVFLRAFQALPRFETRNGSTVLTWLHAIARNRAVDYIRRQSKATIVSLDDAASRAEATLTIADTLPAAGISPETRIFFQEVMQEVNALCPAWRVPMLLKLEGYTLDEIGKAMGMLSVICIKSRIVRAQRRLRDRVG